MSNAITATKYSRLANADEVGIAIESEADEMAMESRTLSVEASQASQAFNFTSAFDYKQTDFKSKHNYDSAFTYR